MIKIEIICAWCELFIEYENFESVAECLEKDKWGVEPEGVLCASCKKGNIRP